MHVDTLDSRQPRCGGIHRHLDSTNYWLITTLTRRTEPTISTNNKIRRLISRLVNDLMRIKCVVALEQKNVNKLTVRKSTQ